MTATPTGGPSVPTGGPPVPTGGPSVPTGGPSTGAALRRASTAGHGRQALLPWDGTCCVGHPPGAAGAGRAAPGARSGGLCLALTREELCLEPIAEHTCILPAFLAHCRDPLEPWRPALGTWTQWFLSNTHVHVCAAWLVAAGTRWSRGALLPCCEPARGTWCGCARVAPSPTPSPPRSTLPWPCRRSLPLCPSTRWLSGHGCWPGSAMSASRLAGMRAGGMCCLAQLLRPGSCRACPAPTPDPKPCPQGLPPEALPPALATRAGREPDGVSLVWKARRLQVGLGHRRSPQRIGLARSMCVARRCVPPVHGSSDRGSRPPARLPTPPCLACPLARPRSLQALVIQDWPGLAPNVTAALKEFEWVRARSACCSDRPAVPAAPRSAVRALQPCEQATWLPAQRSCLVVCWLHGLQMQFID